MNDQPEITCPDAQEAPSREELIGKLANCLKHERKAQNRSIEEIALSLKLRPVYLQALESGSWDDMPGEVYAIAFLKQYAAFLNMDVSESVEKLKSGQYRLTRPVTFPDPPIAPNRTWIIVAALLFVMLFILFNLFFDSGETEQSDVPLVEITGTAPAPEMNSVMPSKPAATALAVAPTELRSETSITTMPESDIEHEYKLSAIGEDVWFQLLLEGEAGEKATLLKEALLRDGESATLYHKSASLLLTCGNATALQVHIDGKLVIAAGSLGQSGEVLRNFKLTAE